MTLVKYLIPGVLLSLALLSLLLRLGLPYIDFYKADVAKALSERTGETVHIEQIQASLGAYLPVISVSNIALGHPSDSDYLRIGRLVAEINLWQSLWQRQPVIDSIHLLDGELNMVRDMNDQFQFHPLVAGMLTGGGGDNDIELALSNMQVRVHLERDARTDLFMLEQFVLQKEQDEYRLGARLQLPSSLGERLQFSANIVGDLLDFNTWQGRFYVEGERMVISEWLHQGRLEQDYSGTLDTRVWGQFETLKIGWISGNFACSRCRMEGLSFDMQTNIYVENTAQSWHVEVANTDFKSAQVNVQQVSLGMRQRRAEPFVDVALIGENFSGDVLQKLRQQLPQLDEYAQGFDLNTQAGSLRASIRLPMQAYSFPNREWLQSLAQQTDMFKAFSLKAQLHDGYIAMNDVKQSFDHIAVQMHGIRGAEDSVLAVDTLSFADDKTELHARLAWYEEKDLIPNLRVSATLNDIDVQTLFGWLGEAVPEKALSEIKQVLQDGTIKQAQLSWHGGIASSLDASMMDTLVLQAQLEDFSITHETMHKPIHDLDVALQLNNNALTATVHDLRYEEYRFENAQIDIGDIKQPYMLLRGRGSGEIESLIQILELADVLDADTFQGIDFGGDATLDLVISMPLSDDVKRPSKIEGEIKLNAGLLHIKAHDLHFDQIDTSLKFNGDAIRANAINARLDKRYPLQGNLTSSKENISLRLRLPELPTLFLAQRFFPDYKYMFSGHADWEVLLELPPLNAQNDDVRITLRSNLAGTALDLPAPFNKPAATASPFSLDIVWRGDTERYDLRYANVIGGYFQYNKDKLQRAHIHLGHTQLPDVPTPFALTGSIQQAVALDKWTALFKTDEDSPDTIPSPLYIDLEFKDLSYGANHFAAVAVTANAQSASHWHADIDSEMIKGSIKSGVKKDKMFITAQLDSLILPNDEASADKPTDTTDPTDQTKKTQLKPEDLPIIEATVKQARYGDFSCADLSVTTDYEENKWILDDFHCRVNEVHINMNGEWVQSGKVETTTAHFQVQGNDYGAWLTQWNLTNELKSGKGITEGEVKWRGGPDAFALDKLRGVVELDLEDVSIEKINIGSGVMRLFSFLNLGNIMRYLTGDLTDLLKQDLPFEDFHAKFVLKEENMDTDLSMSNIALSLTMNGRIGIRARDYDQMVEVIPKLTSNLSVVGGLLGGPLANVAILLAELTNLDKKIDEIYALQYHMTGSWDNPEIRLVDAKEKNSTDNTPRQEKTGEKEVQQEQEKKEEEISNPLDWVTKQFKKGRDLILPEKK